tara:strand:- start:772 stop:1047 length:276 start_codon:yes stop_codon:yes gene_type:complete
MENMKNMKRALRRHHVDRLKKVRSRYNHATLRMNDEDMARRVGMLVNTATLCSCEMCGNPRNRKDSSKKYYLTIQEKKADVIMKEELSIAV